jgi:CHAT domain-containing protein
VTERLFVEGIQARETKGQTESATRKLKEALTGWEELKDEYLRELTARQIKQITPLPPDIVVAFRGFYEANGKAQTKLKEAQELMDRSRADALLAREEANDALAELRALGSRVTDKAMIEKISSLNNENLSDALQELRVLTKVGEANCLSAIGQTHYILGEWQAKLDYSKQMISINRQLLADKVFRNSTRLSANYFILKASQAHEFVAAGQMLQTLGQLDEAVEYFNLALESSRRLFQETQSPDFKLDKSLFNFRQDEALVLFELGKTYGRTSKDKNKAIDSLTKAVEIYKFIDRKREAANGLFVIGDLFASEFDFEAALKNVDESLKSFEELNDKSGQFKVLELKGIIYFWLNDKTKSKEFLNQGIEILQSPGFNENDKKNRFADLRPGFWRERIDDAIERERLEGVATAYRFQEDFRRSNDYYEKSLLIARSNRESKIVRTTLDSIALNYASLKEWNKAAEYYRQALDISRHTEVKEDIASDLQDVGWTLLEAGKPQEALSFQNEAFVNYQSVGVDESKVFAPAYSSLLNETSRSYYGRGNKRLAIFYGKRAVNAMQGERQRLQKLDAVFQKGFLGKKEKHYRRLANWLIDAGRLLEAEQVLQMLKEEEVLSYLRRDASEADKLQKRADLSADEKDALTRYDSMADRIAAVGLEFDQLQELKRQGVMLSAEQQKRFADLAKETQDANNIFQAFLKQLYEEFAKRTNVKKDLQENLGLKRDLKKWGEGVVFLYTLVGEDRYRVILTTPRSQTDGKTEIRSEILNKKISDFRRALQDPAVDPRPLGKELYDILIKPIEKQLDGAKAKTLLWSLDGNLRLLPVAALWDGQQYFGQRYQNVTITLASRTRLGEANVPDWRVLGLGVTQSKTIREPNGTRDLPFSALPAVKTELASIVKNDKSSIGIMPGQILLDDDFNETELKKELLKGYQVIHIASHFSLNAGDATKSFLVMGGGQILTVNELKTSEELSFEDVDLLTLSACQTAVVEKDGSGKEIEGFGYVAQQKGAKAILATLWSVVDESTQVLMSEFYRLHQANPRLTKIGALQLAQQEMIEGKLQPKLASIGSKSPGTKQDGTSERTTNDDTVHPAGQGPTFPYDPKKPYAHPYYWAPFILIGNWK